MPRGAQTVGNLSPRGTRRVRDRERLERNLVDRRVGCPPSGGALKGLKRCGSALEYISMATIGYTDFCCVTLIVDLARSSTCAKESIIGLLRTFPVRREVVPCMEKSLGR